jgi:hypothetical protein
MPLAVYIAYLLVSALMLVEGMILRRALRETVWLGRVLGSNGEPVRENGQRRLSVGSLAPRFRAKTILGENISSDKFKGHRTILLFVSPEMNDDHEIIARLAAVIPGLQFRAGKSLYLVCTGETEACKSMIGNLLPPGSESFALADPYRHIHRAFRINSDPTAVQMDTEGRILQYGYPLSMIDGDLPAGVDAMQEANQTFSTTRQNGQ